jgi:tetratricopeptide (TPR) repeat protein
MKNEKPQKAAVLALLIVCTIAAFLPIVQNKFINFDDTGYITMNGVVRTGLSLDEIRWAFTSTAEGNWHPLTWISHAVDCSLFGLEPGYHHAMNLLLHLVSSILLFLIFDRMTHARWQSAFVAFVFAIHPLHVESVAWAAERKDVLSGLFWMITIGAYTRYTRSPGMRPYLVTLALFALGLLAKPMLVTLPFVLLLLDYWPLGRLHFRTGPSIGALEAPPRSREQILIEKIPFLVLSLASSLVTYLIQQQQGIVAPSIALPLSDRIANAIVSYAIYLRKTVLPTDLAIFYPHSGVGLPAWQTGIAVLALGIVTFIGWKKRSSQPYLLVGWLWFLGTLVPVIGLIQVGLQALADRYMYLPIIGLAIMAAWGLSTLTRGLRYQKPVLAAGFIISVILMGAWTHVQARYWKDNFTLYEHALSVTKENHLAENNLGAALADSGRHSEAIPHIREALKILPNQVTIHVNLARSLVAVGERDEALDEYNWILGRRPADPLLHARIGDLLADEGKNEGATTHFLAAIRLDSTDLLSRSKLAEVYARASKLDEATNVCLALLRLQPDNSQAHDVLGVIAGRQNRNDDAAREFTLAIRFDSLNADALNDMGILYDRMGKGNEAFEMYQKAVRADSGHGDAHLNLGVALAKRQRLAEAADHWVRATRLNPASLDAYLNLGRLYSMESRPEEALRQFASVLRLDSTNVQAHFESGNLLSALGRFPEAESHYADAVRLAPTFSPARAALERVRGLRSH